MEWFKKHVDTAIVLGAILPSLFWFHGKNNDRFNKIEKDLAIIKTVLIMQDIMPKNLAIKDKEDK